MILCPANISKHILQTHAFSRVLTRRISLTLKSFFKLVIIFCILITLNYDLGVILSGSFNW